MKGIGLRQRIGLSRRAQQASLSAPVLSDFRILRTTGDRRIVRGGDPRIVRS